MDRVGRQWNGNLMTLKGASVCMVEYWPHLPKMNWILCPVQCTDTELNGFFDQE